MTTTISGRAAVDDLFAIIDGQRWADYESIMTDDVEMTSPFGVLHGPDEWRAFSQGFARSVPDGHHTVQRCVENGSTVAVDGMWEGTNTGPLVTPDGELPPSGATVGLRFAAVAELRDGRFAKVDVYLDQVSFLTQVGLMPAP